VATSESKHDLIRRSKGSRFPARMEKLEWFCLQGKDQESRPKGNIFAEPNPNPYFGKEEKEKAAWILATKGTKPALIRENKDVGKLCKEQKCKWDYL
jgi:hypothetical protein